MQLLTAILLAIAAPWYLPPQLLSQLESAGAVYRGKITIKKMLVTAYCPCRKCCGKTDGITASGYKIQPSDKFAAADLPFGTILEIPGYGKVPVRDRGGAITGDHIDVFFPTHQEALNWGRKELEVMIYE